MTMTHCRREGRRARERRVQWKGEKEGPSEEEHEEALRAMNRHWNEPEPLQQQWRCCALVIARRID